MHRLKVGQLPRSSNRFDRGNPYRSVAVRNLENDDSSVDDQSGVIHPDPRSFPPASCASDGSCILTPLSLYSTCLSPDRVRMVCLYHVPMLFEDGCRGSLRCCLGVESVSLDAPPKPEVTRFIPSNRNAYTLVKITCWGSCAIAHNLGQSRCSSGADQGEVPFLFYTSLIS